MRTPTPTSTSEPMRLLDESASSLERSLLGAGKSYASSAQTRAKVLAGLGLAAGSTALLTGSAAASTVAKLTWGKLLIGVSLVGAVTAVPIGYYALNHPAPPAKAPVPHSIAPTAADPVAVPDAPAATHAATLSAELGALDRARLSLTGGDARRALDALDAYDRRFPSGRLQLEAEVLRIDALAKLGRKDAARQRAETFLRRHPNSVLATRVRAHVAD
jgi:hypothetical protein